MFIVPEVVCQFPCQGSRFGIAGCDDVFHVFFFVADQASASLFIVFNVFPVLTYLVGILGAFPEEVSCLPSEVFVSGNFPDVLHHWVVVEQFHCACLDNPYISYGFLSQGDLASSA